jgi:hypothetical protein
VRVVLLAFAGAILAAAVPAADAPEKPDPVRLRYCGVMRGCGLPAPDGWCSEETSRGVKGLSYDETRCRDARELHQRGVRPDDLPGYRLYAFLGSRYRVEYAVSGEVALSPARLTYLMSELPLAARLLTRFQGTAYGAEYLDPARRRFRGNKGSKLSGEADLVSGGPQEGLVWYFGVGASKVGPWKLRGRSLMRFEFAPAGEDGRKVAYKVRIVTTPANAVLNAIMNMGVFKSIVNGEIKEMVADVTEASRKLDAQGPSVLEKGEWPPEDKAKLESLLRLP